MWRMANGLDNAALDGQISGRLINKSVITARRITGYFSLFCQDIESFSDSDGYRVDNEI